jgi:hypothetical protein
MCVKMLKNWKCSVLHKIAEGVGLRRWTGHLEGTCPCSR